jgi:hypothetical protein
LRQWARQAKVEREVAALTAIRRRVEAGDLSALDSIAVSSDGAIELHRTNERPHLPPAATPTTYTAKTRTQCKSYVRDCEDVFDRAVSSFQMEVRKIALARQYIDSQRKAIWDKYCQDMEKKQEILGYLRGKT